jgi:hypothetical protein
MLTSTLLLIVFAAQQPAPAPSEKAEIVVTGTRTEGCRIRLADRALPTAA